MAQIQSAGYARKVLIAGQQLSIPLQLRAFTTQQPNRPPSFA